MRVDLNRDFHEKINYFSIFHQCKIVSGRISSCLDEAGVNAAQNKNREPVILLPPASERRVSVLPRSEIRRS